jgi:hypothetical protein
MRCVTKEDLPCISLHISTLKRSFHRTLLSAGKDADGAYAAGYNDGYSDGYDEGEVSCENACPCPAPIQGEQFVAAQQVGWFHV